MPVRSPVAGYVTEKNAVRGLAVQPGTPMFQIADLSTVWLLADVYEHEIGRVKVGQAAALDLAAYPGETFAGKVTFIHPALDSITRTLRVRVELPNRDLRLKPGMYGTVTIQTDRGEALAVPTDAVVDNGAIQYVFVALPEGRFEPRKVTLGGRAGGKVQVLSGVSEGETVVTTANFLLDSESHLQAAILGDGQAGGAPAAPTDICDAEIDKQKYPDKHQQCVACRAHRGMGSMEDDCRKQIPRPWK
jgi:RND family efflux transporter MFP subunit